jgi:hypothetical protein
VQAVSTNAQATLQLLFQKKRRDNTWDKKFIQ